MTMNTNIPPHISPITWMEAGSLLFQFSKHPNLLERDLDSGNMTDNHITCTGVIIQLLNKSFVVGANKTLFQLFCRSFQNKCVTLRWDKCLFPRDCDAQAETLQPYALRP